MDPAAQRTLGREGQELLVQQALFVKESEQPRAILDQHPRGGMHTADLF
jgi:hypothetical protein